MHTTSGMQYQTSRRRCQFIPVRKIHIPYRSDAPTFVMLVAFCAEAVLYGIYLTTFWTCISELLSFTGRITVRRWPFFFVATLLFSVSTFDIALGLLHLLVAFIFFRDSGGPIAELLNVSNWISVARTANYCIQTCIADGMLVYRSYVVWFRDWKIAAGLSIFWLAGLVCSIFLLIVEATLHQRSTLTTSRFMPFSISVAAITLVLNTIATSLIVYRIWFAYRLNKDMSEGNSRNTSTALRRAIRIVIESGAVYTLSVLVLCITCVTKSTSLYVVSECIVQIIGIVFNLIIIRVEKGSTVNPTYCDSMHLSSLQFQGRSAPVDETTTHAGTFTVEQAEAPVDETTTYANASAAEAPHV